MALHEITFASSNDRDTIYGWIYEPVAPPRAIVQIVHGLGEHSRRYLRLIAQLLDAGFVVAADDHSGHGRTAMESGIWADAGADADRVVVDDEQTLLNTVRRQFPDLPVIVFGHSWGSMIARSLASREPDIDGLILGGIAAQMHGIESVLDRTALDVEPGDAPAPDDLVASLFDGFVSRYGEGAGPTDWVAADADVVSDHARDPLNNFGAPMSRRFLKGFVALYDEANSDHWYRSIPESLPVLILAGDGDPVANYGEGAYHVGNRLIEAGRRDVKVHVYTGFRHEVHNEPPIRDPVAQEIIDFAEYAGGRSPR